MFLKICGITRLADAKHAIDEGATALGFILWPKSPRFIASREVAEIVAALPESIVTVGVFVNQMPELISQTMKETGLTTVQLHGDELAASAQALAWPILRSVTLDSFDDVSGGWPEDTTFLVDAADPERRGGTGQAVDWTRAAAIARRRRLVLAGGLTPDNVEEAIVAVHPWGVDVSSGVEESPGLKSAKKVTRFLANARKAERYLQSA